MKMRCLAALLMTATLLPAVIAAEPTADKPVRPVTERATIELYFSPGGGCRAAILREVAKAKKTILVEAYWFTSPAIAQSFVDAHKRGVKVEVLCDRSRLEIDNTQADHLAAEGVPTFVDDKHVTAHSKLLIVDGETVVTGSFNFTEQSEIANSENLLVIRDRAVAAAYAADWKVHREHSVAYVRQ